MSKSAKSSMIPAMSTSEIETAIQAVTLPVTLQGVDTWSGSRDIGGNVASHLAAVNGKGEGVALCQLFADYWFGAESRANILKGITNSMKRKAFEKATENTLRVKRDLASLDMLDFFKAYMRAALAMKKVKAPAITDESKDESNGESKEHATNDDTAKNDAPVSDKDSALALANKRIAELEAALQKAHEMLQAVKLAKSIKDVRTLIAA